MDIVYIKAEQFINVNTGSSIDKKEKAWYDAEKGGVFMHKCSSCAGRELELTAAEIELLEQFSQFPFLPVAKNADGETPIYLEEIYHSVEEYGIILTLLEKKGLISIDYDKPLKNADLSAYAAYAMVGSMALTARGQQVLDILQLQGICE